MATGPDHYREAERLLDLDELLTRATEQRTEPAELATAVLGQIARAQVHATLALAAATAEPIARAHIGPDELSASDVRRVWAKALR